MGENEIWFPLTDFNTDVMDNIIFPFCRLIFCCRLSRLVAHVGGGGWRLPLDRGRAAGPLSTDAPPSVFGEKSCWEGAPL